MIYISTWMSSIRAMQGAIAEDVMNAVITFSTWTLYIRAMHGAIAEDVNELPLAILSNFIPEIINPAKAGFI